MSERVDEACAKAILGSAIAQDRAGELLACLFDGGSATIDARTGDLVLIDGDALKGLLA